MNERYIRHIQLNEVGISGQQKLANAKVLVIGAGGLGCPVLQYLSASGIGTLGIVDHDTVSLSNLQRQILYSCNDIGKQKTHVAKERLHGLNPETNIQVYPVAFTETNCLELIQPYDIVVDGTDNFVTRYLINDACLILGKPMVFGALYKFEGQVSVFNYQNGPSYRCLFPNPPKAGEIPNCNEIGVLGVLSGIIGLLQANEVLKIILDIGQVLTGNILFMNTLTYQQRILKFTKNEDLVITIKKKAKPQAVDTNDCIFIQSVSIDDIQNEEDIHWIDVREEGEIPILDFEHFLKLPLSQFETSIPLANNGIRKIFFCQSGMRSQRAAHWATEQGITNCFSLKEGALELEQWINRKI